MKILVICNKSPWPPKEGGPIAMNMIVDGLAGQGHNVKVLAVNSYKYNIREEDIPAGYRSKTGIELIDVDLRIKPVPAFLNLFTGRSYHVERFISERFRNRLAEILQAEKYDVVQLETLYVAPYIDTIRQYSDSSIVLRAHNIEHLIWARNADSTKNPLKRWYIRHLAKTLKQFEHKAIHQVDGIAAITETDADYFRKKLELSNSPSFSRRGGRREADDGVVLPEKHRRREADDGVVLPEKHRRREADDGVVLPEKHRRREADDGVVISIPFGIDLKNYPAPAPYTGPLTLFSIGAMNWIPNAEGIRWFLEQVWPDLHAGFPELKYFLAGREMPPWMLGLEVSGVEVLGEVEDAAEFINAHGIMIVPLFSGSGIRIKIIEGMAAGKAIISTLVGAEGIDYTNGKDILIANAPCEFVEMVSRCLSDPERTATMGREARKMIEERYDREKIIIKLVTFYKQLKQ